jgi:hypothetical protein
MRSAGEWVANRRPTEGANSHERSGLVLHTYLTPSGEQLWFLAQLTEGASTQGAKLSGKEDRGSGNLLVK